jgi:nucleotide-binding universal stress UspA family protein
MFHDILVAIDDSETAKRALGEATDLARELNAKLTIISVSPPIPSFAYRAGVDTDALQAEAEAESEGIVRDAAKGLSDDLPVTTLVKQGHPGEEIVKQVEAGGHDLVVMGSRGLGRISSNIFGSVGGYVHYHARVPMLIIQPEQ